MVEKDNFFVSSQCGKPGEEKSTQRGCSGCIHCHVYEGWPYLGKEWNHESDFLWVVPHFRRDEAEDDEIFESGGVVLGDEVYHVL